MAKGAPVVLNAAVIGEVLSSNGVRWAQERCANAIADDARGRAPVDTGEYRDSIRIEYDKVGHRPRARVIADDPKATLIENTQRVLGTAADAGR